MCKASLFTGAELSPIVIENDSSLSGSSVEELRLAELIAATTQWLSTDALACPGVLMSHSDLMARIPGTLLTEPRDQA